MMAVMLIKNESLMQTAKTFVASMAFFVGAVAMAGQALVVFANGEMITAKDMAGYVERRVDLKAMARNEFGAESILEEMAMTRALILEGQELGIEPPDGKSIGRFDDIYAMGVYQKISSNCIAPESEKEKREFFDANPEAFRVPASARLGRIMVPSKESIDGKSAGEILLSWAQSIVLEMANFDDYAQKAERYYSLDVQGDLGWVSLVDDIPIMRALNSAKQGELVGPVFDGGYVYLFNVVAKREARQLTWDESILEVPRRAVLFCRQNEQEKIKNRLHQKYSIKIHRDLLKSSFIQR